MAKTTKRTTTEKTTAKRDLYREVTDRIIASLKDGVVPWRRPWAQGKGTNPLYARNALTGRAYNGINSLLLGTSPHAYGDNRWLTFRQAQEAGGCVRKGEHGQMIVFWKFVEAEGEDKNGNPVTKKIPFLRSFTVFNIAQCDGLDEAKLKSEAMTSEPMSEAELLESCEAIVAGYSDMPALTHGGDRAYYAPGIDQIRMPERQAFESAEAYYGVLFHEMVHSTGHATRTGRFNGKEEMGHFGSAVYSQEELVAEIGSAFLCTMAGIEDTTYDNSTSYIGHWLEKLENDPKMIVMAASQARKSAEYILCGNAGKES